MWTGIWAVVFVVTLLIELMTAGLATIWFAVGALVALVLSALKVHYIIQIVAFVVVSLATLFLTRPLLKKLMAKKTPPTNTDRSIGRKTIVIEPVDGLTGNGSVKIDGIIWSAKAENEDDIFEKGTKVIVKKVEGVTLIVAKAEEPGEI